MRGHINNGCSDGDLENIVLDSAYLKYHGYDHRTKVFRNESGDRCCVIEFMHATGMKRKTAYNMLHKWADGEIDKGELFGYDPDAEKNGGGNAAWHALDDEHPRDENLDKIKVGKYDKI